MTIQAFQCIAGLPGNKKIPKALHPTTTKNGVVAIRPTFMLRQLKKMKKKESPGNHQRANRLIGITGHEDGKLERYTQHPEQVLSWVSFLPKKGG